MKNCSTALNMAKFLRRIMLSDMLLKKTDVSYHTFYFMQISEKSNFLYNRLYIMIVLFEVI